MNTNFSDEQLDRILEKIVKDSLLTEEAINEIADSPKLRWNVQSRIKTEKANHRKGWIPTWLDWRSAAFAALAFVFCGGLIWSVNFKEKDSVTEVKQLDAPIVEVSKIDEREVRFEPKSKNLPKTVSGKNLPKNSPAKIKPQSNVLPKPPKVVIQVKQSPKILPQIATIKTDFIALAYSPAPESGQILKVKVPRSMMVSLGVAANLENSSQLINAEVLMGDDGLARAIRFVQ